MVKRPTEKQFFEVVGRAVVAWQGVETSTAGLFVKLLKAGNEVGAHALLYRVGNFAMRIELLDIAAKYLPTVSDDLGDLPKRWEGLRGRLYSASDLRNRIAHSELGADARGLKLRPSLFDWSRLDPADLMKGVRARASREVDYATVKGAEQHFETLSYDLSFFGNDVASLNVKRNGKWSKTGRKSS